MMKSRSKIIGQRLTNPRISLRTLYRHLCARRIAILHNKYDGTKAVLDYPPSYVTVAIGGYCIYRCVYCASHCPDSGKNQYSNHQYKMNYWMHYDEFCRLVDMCYEAKVPHVHMVAAGEPFLHRDVLKMMDYLSERYGALTIQTDFDSRLFKKRQLLDAIVRRKDRILSITTDVFPSDIHNDIKLGSRYEHLMDAMEYLSLRTQIFFRLHLILTKETYKNVDLVLHDLHKRKIRAAYDIANLHPYGFNDFTSMRNVYLSKDAHITKSLVEAKSLGKQLGLEVNIPKPWDKSSGNEKGNCINFWSRFQVIPSKKLPKERWIGNVVPSQCNAAVMGTLFSLGNIFDYDNLMDFWNNEKIVKIREDLMRGRFPDPACEKCFKFRR